MRDTADGKTVGRFAECVRRSPVILTEGAVIERLRRDADVPLGPFVLHAGFIYVNFLFAATLPTAAEARGIALAAADCQVPYVLSFVVRRDGTLLDGTPLDEAVAGIDAAVGSPPLFYMVNCNLRD